jgi:type I restriction enzyme S subunit
MGESGPAKYRPYPAYKPSGVDWVEVIPAGWELKPLAVLCDFQQGKAHEPFIDDTGSFICVNARFVSTEGVARKYCTKNLTPAKKDDVLMVMSDLPNGRALAKGYFVKDEGPYAVNQRVCRLTAKQADSRFLFYQLSRNPYFLRFNDGSNQTHLSNAAFTKFPALVPSILEQTKIAAFLDHETAKIDALIAKQQRLIALLEEKRQAVISHAVTKGLDPTASLRPSGIDWLGDVPEHWEVSKFAFLKTVLTDYTANGSFAGLKENVTYLDEPNYARLVRLTDLRKSLKNENGVWIDQKSYTYLGKSALFGGEFLLANVGAHAGLFYEMPLNAGPASLAPNMFMAKFDQTKILRRYMAYAGQSKAVNSQLVLSATASSAQPKLNKDDFKSVRICYPSLTEQAVIVEYLDGFLENHANLYSKAHSAIALLKERRTALISAAVTGKIDLRDWQAPEGATGISSQDINQPEEALS